MRTFSALLLLSTISAIAPVASFAAPITVPTDLIVGDTYRLAFVTTTVRDGTSTDIADYNAFVTAVANGVPELAALGTTWAAIGSTSAIAARDNTGTNPTVSTGVPIYLLNNTRIADDNADLWDGSIAVALVINENGSSTNAEPWTGSTMAGLADPSFPLGASSPRAGKSYVNNSQWVHDNAWPSNFGLQLYAISGELTVVPEPGAMALAGSGLAVLAFIAWGRRYARASATAFAAVTVLSLTVNSTCATPIVIGVNPFASYLRINGDSAADTVPIDLASLGIAAGDNIRLERLGDWEAGGGCSFEACTGLAGVFSASNLLLGSDQLNRVQDAIDAGPDIITGPTQSGGLPTDIPEDFRISTEFFEFPQVASVIVQVPPLASYLFVAVPDIRYGDNSDPDGDFALQIQVVPEPGAGTLLCLAFPVLMIRAWRGRRI